MNEKLQKAIKLIEDHGGIVMMQDETEDFSLYDHEDMIAKESEEKAQLKAWQEERKRRLELMGEEFDDMLGSKNFSITMVENMIHGLGLDMDDLENYIFDHY